MATDNTVMEQEKLPEHISVFTVMARRARRGKVHLIVLTMAIFMAFLEIFYIMNFHGTLVNFIEGLGLTSLAEFINRSLYLDLNISLILVMAILVAVGFLIYPAKRPPTKATEEQLREFMRKYVDRIPLYDYILAAIGFIVIAYNAWLQPYVVANEGSIPENLTGISIIMAILGFIMVIEVTRRAVGPWMIFVMIVFLLYYLNFYRFDALKWATDMFYAREGLFNIPYTVMAMYVFAFLFFGNFLEQIGIGNYITRLMLGLFGKKPGGPAKVSIVSSGFMGMLSGSSVANVFTTGVFTIPLMKKSGFPPEVAGAVEASASTGGQIMPPIMGAAAFIMASYLGRPYGDIVIAGFLPAFIYFASLYYFVDLEAKRRSLKGLTEVPDVKPMLRKLYLLSPVALIVYLLVIRLPPQHAVVASLSLALIAAVWATDFLKLSTKITYTITGIALYIIGYLVGLNNLATAYFGGISLLLLTFILYLVPALRPFSQVIIRSIEQAVRNSIPVFMAAAMAGVIQGSLTLTGLSTRLGETLIAIAHNNIYLLLIFAGLISILVGMGVPTTANYVITSLISATAIMTAAQTMLGIPAAAALLAANMFVFYYGILADVTPPVALAAFAGATVARADFWKTAVNATRMAFAKYVLPFIFAVNPAMLIIPIMEGEATVGQLIYAIIATIGVIISASAGFAGYLGGHIRRNWLRVLLAVVGILAVTTNLYLVIATYVLSIITYLLARKGLA
ncbi:MAG: TRAP transporter fused permease subunit [Desulfurococcales archaeon]|nr:TRAP transporter fused permease subunit [Desulfurococcales archaeon]